MIIFTVFSRPYIKSSSLHNPDGLPRDLGNQYLSPSKFWQQRLQSHADALNCKQSGCDVGEGEDVK